MKRILLFLSILLFGVQAISQAQEIRTKNGFISISLGPSFPLGDFASSDFSNSDAGFADNGVAVNLINFGYLFSENFGITAMLAGAAFPLDVDSNDDPIWAYGSLLVGPLVSFQTASKVELDIRAMIGTFTATLDPDDGSDEVEGESGAFSLGTAVRYHVSDAISLTTGLDFITANPEFNFDGADFNQSISSLNLTFGISFRLK